MNSTLALDVLGEFDSILDMTGSSPEVDAVTLAEQWIGRVFLVPPYGPLTKKYMTKMVNHHHGTALVAARTETTLFQRYVFSHATAILFIDGRIPVGTALREVPAALVAYGMEDALALLSADIKGTFLWVNGAAATRTGDSGLA